jgi:hypothetical protein
MLLMRANSIAESIMRSTKAAPRGNSDIVARVDIEMNTKGYCFSNWGDSSNSVYRLRVSEWNDNKASKKKRRCWGLYGVDVAAHAFCATTSSQQLKGLRVSTASRVLDKPGDLLTVTPACCICQFRWGLFD